MKSLLSFAHVGLAATVFSSLPACFGNEEQSDDCTVTVPDENGVQQQIPCDQAGESVEDDTGMDDHDTDEPGTSDPSEMNATAAQAEVYGAALGDYGYCLASWFPPYSGYAIGTLGEGFGPEDGWQKAVATASRDNNDYGSWCTSFRYFGGGAFRWGAAIVDASTLAPIVWIEIDELPESEFIIDVLECDLDDPEDLVRKQNFCAAYGTDGDAIASDCGLTYVAPPECENDQDIEDNGDDVDDAGDNSGSTDTTTCTLTVAVDGDASIESVSDYYAEVYILPMNSSGVSISSAYWPSGDWNTQSSSSMTEALSFSDGGTDTDTFSFSSSTIGSVKVSGGVWNGSTNAFVRWLAGNYSDQMGASVTMSKTCGGTTTTMLCGMSGDDYLCQ